MTAKTASLEERFFAGEERALARAISLTESGSQEGRDLLGRLRKKSGRARIIGVTGSPGSGKSSLVDRLISVARSKGKRVAVIAVDPSSPFSGGAIMGDRIRMMRWHQDKDVYIRSMATRGHLGGLAAATLQAMAVLEAFGFDDIFVETVGVGQSEIDIVRAADSVLLVLTPGQGDGVQAFKAGIMEIADIYAINKFDLPGAGRFRGEIMAALELAAIAPEEWRPPIIPSVALKDEGSEELFVALDGHYAYLQEHDLLGQGRDARLRSEAAAIIAAEFNRAFESEGTEFVERVLQGELSAKGALAILLKKD